MINEASGYQNQQLNGDSKFNYFLGNDKHKKSVFTSQW